MCLRARRVSYSSPMAAAAAVTARAMTTSPASCARPASEPCCWIYSPRGGGAGRKYRRSGSTSSCWRSAGRGGTLWLKSRPTRAAESRLLRIQHRRRCGPDGRGRVGDQIAAVVSRGGRPDLAGDALRTDRPDAPHRRRLDDPVIQLNDEPVPNPLPDKDFRIVPGATHLFEEHGKLEEVAHLSAAWFPKHLGRAAARWTTDERHDVQGPEARRQLLAGALTQFADRRT